MKHLLLYLLLLASIIGITAGVTVMVKNMQKTKIEIQSIKKSSEFPNAAEQQKSSNPFTSLGNLSTNSASKRPLSTGVEFMKVLKDLRDADDGDVGAKDALKSSISTL